MGCEKNKNQRWKECEVKLDDVDKWGVRKKMVKSGRTETGCKTRDC